MNKITQKVNVLPQCCLLKREQAQFQVLSQCQQISQVIGINLFPMHERALSRISQEQL